ncbi:hypothetical protein HK405_006201 [Cladochytrium tenue]|nr:hypothetical protein HK405_006201 [Cladochytrium tenue]
MAPQKGATRAGANKQGNERGAASTVAGAGANKNKRSLADVARRVTAGASKDRKPSFADVAAAATRAGRAQGRWQTQSRVNRQLRQQTMQPTTQPMRQAWQPRRRQTWAAMQSNLRQHVVPATQKPAAAGTTRKKRFRADAFVPALQGEQ